MLDFWTEQHTTAICALIGAVIAIFYNYDFVVEKKRIGWTVAVGSGILPVFTTNAAVGYFQIDDLSIARLIGLVSGMIAFGAVRFIMENQTGIVKKLGSRFVEKEDKNGRS